MIGSLFAGISGLNANSTAMTVIGDNIANVNTTAYKANRSMFANVLSQSLGGSINNGIGRRILGYQSAVDPGVAGKHQQPHRSGHQRQGLLYRAG